MALCDICEMDEQWCGHSALAKAAEAVPEFLIDGPTISAVFGGECANCGSHYRIDSEITHADVGWVCSGCKAKAIQSTSARDTDSRLFDGI